MFLNELIQACMSKKWKNINLLSHSSLKTFNKFKQSVLIMFKLRNLFSLQYNQELQL